MVFIIPSYKTSLKVEDPKKVVEDHNGAKYKATNGLDAQFLVNEAKIQMEEFKLGELAQTSGIMLETK